MRNRENTSVSIIIRALNEAEFLPECLAKISQQDYAGSVEVILVDSGSTDATVEIAETFGAKIVYIKKAEFSFGRSLNMGCAKATGELLVILSAHCIPTDKLWLQNLVQPLVDNVSKYAYGRQIARKGVSKFSEAMVFKKYYPEITSNPQAGYFCNNANSAIHWATWNTHRFNEELTGLEDMEFAKRLVNQGGTISYVSNSTVEHIHRENWSRIKIRYEREAAALTSIEPNLNLSLVNATRMYCFAVYSDIRALESISFGALKEISLYRLCQYSGSYLGSQSSRERIRKMQKEYFYPKQMGEVVRIGDSDGHNSVASNESS